MVRGIDFLRLALLAAQAKDGKRDLVLAVRRQSPHGFKSFSSSLSMGHDARP